MSPALFVAAHPDDEVLMACVAIAEHVRAGQDVHVLWVTCGEASSVREILNGDGTAGWWGLPHDPQAEGYPPLTENDFTEARMRETIAATLLLGTGYPGKLTLWESGLPDGGVTQADAESAIRAVADELGGPVRLKTHSHIVDNHPDHLAIGVAAEALKAAEPARFGDVRHYILPAYWSDARLSQVAESWDRPADEGVVQRCKLAVRAFAAWSPPDSFAIGHHSVPGMFATLSASPKSMVHP